MAKNSIDVYGAAGKTNVLRFNPTTLTLVNDPTHPLYDDRIHLPIDEGMVLNIMDQGVLEPIIVWKDPETGASCVVDGRQRVRHAIEANARLIARGSKPLEVQAVVKAGSAIRMSQAMISANEIRRADTPIGRAKKMAALLDRGHDHEDLALVFGCTTQTVRNTLELLNTCGAVQQAVEAGQINTGQARQLAQLAPDQQRERVADLVQAGEGATPRERTRKQRAVMGEAKPRMRNRKEIEAELEQSSGERADALRWVLGLQPEGATEQESEDVRTGNLFDEGQHV